MIQGVTEGYEKKLEVNGVGYRAQKQGKKLTLSLGYSHPVEMEDPEGIETVLDGQNIIIVKGISKEKVGQYAAEIMLWISVLVRPCKDFIFFKSFGLVTTMCPSSSLISISTGKSLTSVPFGPLTVTLLFSAIVTVTPAEIREKRRPEPYKGKGIKYADEVIRRKVGKTGKK